MNEITCGLCMDLIPLVQDGIASGESRDAVERHVQSCAACRKLYSGDPPPASDPEKAFRQFRQQARLFYIMLMAFGIFFGLGLTGGSELFYNSLIMPVIGGLGYVLFRWKAVYRVPVLLLLAHGLMNVFRLAGETERLDGYSLLIWTAIYSVFALTGILIAGLLHFAFRKEGEI